MVSPRSACAHLTASPVCGVAADLVRMTHYFATSIQVTAKGAPSYASIILMSFALHPHSLHPHLPPARDYSPRTTLIPLHATPSNEPCDRYVCQLAWFEADPPTESHMHSAAIFPQAKDLSYTGRRRFSFAIIQDVVKLQLRLVAPSIPSARRKWRRMG